MQGNYISWLNGKIYPPDLLKSKEMMVSPAAGASSVKASGSSFSFSNRLFVFSSGSTCIKSFVMSASGDSTGFNTFSV